MLIVSRIKRFLELYYTYVVILFKYLRVSIMDRYVYYYCIRSPFGVYFRTVYRFLTRSGGLSARSSFPSSELCQGEAKLSDAGRDCRSYNEYEVMKY